jgi:hypothetical protein
MSEPDPARRPLDYETPPPPSQTAERYTLEDEDAESDLHGALARRGMIGAGVILFSLGVMFIFLGAWCTGVALLLAGALVLSVSNT